jgi:ATP-dependent Clp protease ATP-binding subunit ClpA
MANPDEFVGDIFFPSGHFRLELLDHRATEVLQEAIRLAKETNWDRIRSAHIFMGLLAVPDQGVCHWAKRLGADLPELLEQFQELFNQEKPADAAPIALHREFLSDNAIRLLREALIRSLDCDRSRISPMDLLITILTAPKSFIAECFEHFGLTAAKLTEWAVLAEFRGNQVVKKA